MGNVAVAAGGGDGNRDATGGGTGSGGDGNRDATTRNANRRWNNRSSGRTSQPPEEPPLASIDESAPTSMPAPDVSKEDASYMKSSAASELKRLVGKEGRGRAEFDLLQGGIQGRSPVQRMGRTFLRDHNQVLHRHGREPPEHQRQASRCRKGRSVDRIFPEACADEEGRDQGACQWWSHPRCL